MKSTAIALLFHYIQTGFRKSDNTHPNLQAQQRFSDKRLRLKEKSAELKIKPCAKNKFNKPFLTLINNTMAKIAQKDINDALKA
jgi:hypothetical protein